MVIHYFIAMGPITILFMHKGFVVRVLMNDEEADRPFINTMLVFPLNWDPNFILTLTDYTTDTPKTHSQADCKIGYIPMRVRRKNGPNCYIDAKQFIKGFIDDLIAKVGTKYIR